MPQLVEDYLSGKVKVDEFATHSMPLVDINKAFDLMHEGKRSVAAENECRLSLSLFLSQESSMPYSRLLFILFCSIRSVVTY